MEKPTMTEQQDKSEAYLELTVEIASAYVANNPVPAGDLANLIGDIHRSLTTLGSENTEAPAVALSPAVPIKKSIQPDHLVCLEDGKKFRSLKRHLAAHHDLTPEEYRRKWGLPADYPMTAPAYSASRSALAKEMGLGRKPAAQPEPEPEVTTPKRRGRKPKEA